MRKAWKISPINCVHPHTAKEATFSCLRPVTNKISPLYTSWRHFGFINWSQRGERVKFKTFKQSGEVQSFQPPRFHMCPKEKVAFSACVDHIGVSSKAFEAEISRKISRGRIFQAKEKWNVQTWRYWSYRPLGNTRLPGTRDRKQGTKSLEWLAKLR